MPTIEGLGSIGSLMRVYQIHPRLQLAVYATHPPSARVRPFLKLLDVEHGCVETVPAPVSTGMRRIDLHLLAVKPAQGTLALDAELERRHKGAVYWVGVQRCEKGALQVYFTGNRMAPWFLHSEVLEPLIAWCLGGENIAFVHSSSFVWQGCGVLCSGGRHTGKTLTLLHALVRGATYLADDFTFLEPLSSGAGPTNATVRRYARRANLFSPHFAAVSPLARRWTTMPWDDRIEILAKGLLRRITRGFITLGYQRHVTDLLSCRAQDSAILGGVLCLIRAQRWPADSGCFLLPVHPADAAEHIVTNTLGEWTATLASLLLRGLTSTLPRLVAEALTDVPCWFVKALEPTNTDPKGQERFLTALDEVLAEMADDVMPQKGPRSDEERK